MAFYNGKFVSSKKRTSETPWSKWNNLPITRCDQKEIEELQRKHEQLNPEEAKLRYPAHRSGRIGHERWRRRNPLKYRAIMSMRATVRQLYVRRATPTWLTHAHRKEIRATYIAAAERSESTGVKHHVDHVVPLRGKTVCGLHVPWNLQIIPAAENMKKRNKLMV
jgi:hypothetical protein